MQQESTIKDGEPCGHPGCLNHVTHPCEGCGRVAGRTEYKQRESLLMDDNKNERKMKSEKELQEAHEEVQGALMNPAHQVYFRAGLLACREYMARFVGAQNPSTADSIRANWWPQLGEDPGVPRRLDFSEVANGDQDGPWPWTPKEVSASVEALPIAEQFLIKCQAR